MKNFILIFSLLIIAQSAQSQILISLLFGDKLNSPRIEFGLEGGVNFSSISNLEGADSRANFNLGFYFDYKLHNPSWMLSTGVIVKSTMGANGLALYPLNDANLDASFAGGTVDRKIKYFNVPIMIKYKINQNIYVKAGPQLGLLSKAYDEFKNEYQGEDLTYKNNIRDQLHVIDAGLALGAGYRLLKGQGMNLGVNYYYGLVSINKGDASPKQYNRSFYITAGIPIGKGKAAKKAAEKENE
jgi:hypothetical protein